MKKENNKSEYNKAHEEMECWETQKHLKGCEKCHSQFLSDYKKELKKRIENIQILCYDKGGNPQQGYFAIESILNLLEERSET